MTPLIMVISFSDSMQLTFAARDQPMAGKAETRRPASLFHCDCRRPSPQASAFLWVFLRRLRLATEIGRLGVSAEPRSDGGAGH
jgi:hypothetical protein